jgi:hypothetical protein
LAQRNSSTTSPVIWTRKKNTKKNMPPSSSILPLILPSTVNYAQPFFNVVTPSTIHRSVQLLFSITHKQTKLPIHAFLATTMDIFPPQACKKLRANENKKMKP